MRRDGVLADALRGAIAGVVASAAMGKVTTALYERQGRSDRRREDRARGGKQAMEVAASKIAGVVGQGLSRQDEQRAGEALHWALGVGAGALYGVLRRRMPVVRSGRGLGFGLAFWLVADEIGVPAAGLTPGPGAFPLATHARGLAGHLTFGATADAVLAVAEKIPLPSSDSNAVHDPRKAEFAERLDRVGGPLARKLTIG